MKIPLLSSLVGLLGLFIWRQHNTNVNTISNLSTEIDESKNTIPNIINQDINESSDSEEISSDDEVSERELELTDDDEL